MNFVRGETSVVSLPFLELDVAGSHTLDPGRSSRERMREAWAERGERPEIPDNPDRAESAPLENDRNMRTLDTKERPRACRVRRNAQPVTRRKSPVR